MVSYLMMPLADLAVATRMEYIYMYDVLIHSPYPRQKSQGNAVTALRMKNMLTAEGLRVAIHERGDFPLEAQCLIALNARKSAEEIFAFCERQPASAVVALLTGTDVNHPEMEDSCSSTIRALHRSDAIVALHDGFAHRIPDVLLAKTQAIYPSVKIPDTVKHLPTDEREVVIAGNFRDEKNPNLLMRGVSELVGEAIQFHAYGAGGNYQEALENMGNKYDNFWLHGVQDHEVVLARMQSASVLLNTSTEEGGANAICEAVAIGLPVIASRIDGNVGMLGQDYAGFFTSDDVDDLAKLLRRVFTEKGLYKLLKQQVSERAELFSYQREAAEWVGLVEKMMK